MCYKKQCDGFFFSFFLLHNVEDLELGKYIQRKGCFPQGAQFKLHFGFDDEKFHNEQLASMSLQDYFK